MKKKIIWYSILRSFFHFTRMRWKYIWDSRFSDSLSLSYFWFFFMDCPERGVSIVLYCRQHEYVKNAGRKKIIFIFCPCCATNKLQEKWVRSWFHLNCGWRRAFHPSLSCKSSLVFWKCCNPAESVLAFLIAIAFAYNNAQHTVYFWHRLIWGSRVETCISETM